MKTNYTNMKKIVFILLCSGLVSGIFAQTETTNENNIPIVLSIEDFRELALNNNKSIKISEERIQAATQLKKAAFTQFLPNFSANGTYLWNEKNISLLGEDALLPIGTQMADGSFGFRQDQINNQWMQVEPGVFAPLDANGVPFDPQMNPEKIQWKDYAYLPKEAMEFDMKHVFAGGIGFVQPIFMGNKIRELYKIAKTSEQLSEIGQKSDIENLLVEVDEAYWRTVSLINKKKLAEEYTILLTKLTNDVGLMIEEGVATKGDLLNVKVKLNQAQLTLAKAENGLQLSRMALFQLCGLEISGNYELLDVDIDQNVIADIAFDINQVFDARHEMQQLEQMQKIAQSNENVMASRFMPNLVLAGNYVFSNPNVFNGFSKKTDGMFNASLVLNVPLFHFGDKIHTLKAAKHETKILNYQIEEAKEKIELQLNQSRFRIIEANKKLESAVLNIESADENLKLANESYAEGLISVSDLMAAQTAWITAHSDRVDAGIEVRLCDLYLKKAKGILEISKNR